MSNLLLSPVWMTVGGTAINAMSMGAGVTSDAVQIGNEDNPFMQMKWTGTPTGTFDVQVSLDPTNLGWISLGLTGLTNPAGAAGSNGVDLNQMGAYYVRLVYTRVSSTGALSVKISAKSV